MHTPTARFASIRRVGGLYHWRIGRLGGSFYRVRKSQATRSNRITVALAMLATTVTVAACVHKPTDATYAAIVQTGAPGVEYQVASRLSLSECAARLADLPRTIAYCESETE